MKHILLVGNSHLFCVLDAAMRLSGAASEEKRTESIWRTDIQTHDIELPGPPPVRARFILAGGVAPHFISLDPYAFMRIDAGGILSVRRRYLDALDDGVTHLDGRVDQVVSCFRGNEQTIFSLMEHATPFDVLVDRADVAATSSGPPRQIVPVELVRRELGARAYPTVFYCRMLRSLFAEQDVAHVVSPPPIADEGYIRERSEVFARVIEEFGLAPAALRRKVYRLYVDVLQAGLRGSGVRLLTAPEASSVDGYLKAEFWSEATHANHRYGRLVLEQLGVA